MDIIQSTQSSFSDIFQADSNSEIDERT